MSTSTEIFPTQYSTLSTAALNHLIGERYQFTDCQTNLIIHGVSDTYRVKSKQGDFIFKIYRAVHRLKEELQGELEMLHLLEEHGTKIGMPISDQVGEEIQEIRAAEGMRFGVLYSYAKGKSYYDFTEEQLKKVGREMAKMHELTGSVNLNYPRGVYTVETTFTAPMNVMKPAFEEIPEEYEYLEKIGKEVIAQLENFDTAAFSYGYCHYDLLPKNFHLDEEGEITFFDFDFLGKGYLVNDVMVFIMHYFFHVVFKGMDQGEAQKCIEHFVEAYREVRDLSEEELEAVKPLGFLFWTFFLAFQYENFEDWSNVFFNTRYLKERVAIIKKWMEW